MGLFKKLVIADRMALFADPVFADPAALRQRRGLARRHRLRHANLLRLLRLHGHGDRLAHLLGYKLAHNFNMPYLAANIAEFWRRWHMSLSSWLRDLSVHPAGAAAAARELAGPATSW